MKNIEKYTNTKDALEAWKKSRWNHKGLFADWLNYEYEAPRVPTLTNPSTCAIKWLYTEDDKEAL